MRHRLANGLLVLLAHIVLALPAYGQQVTIRSIEVNGNSAFTTREILQWLSMKPSGSFLPSSLANDRRTIVDMYRRQGFLAAGVDSVAASYSPDSSYVDLILWVREGRQTIIGSLTFQGAVTLPAAELLRECEVGVGDPLDESLFEADIENVLSLYEQRGYPLARCSVMGMSKREGNDRDTLDITLHIIEGQRVTIDEIKVEGNKETDASVIVRETRLNPGEVYSPSKVEAIRQRLSRLNIFANVEEPQLYLRNDRAGLLLRVREGNTNTFDGVVGYVPGGISGEAGYLTGLASISMRNLLGTGRKLSFRWQREDRYSQELTVRYLEPWIAGFPVNVGVGFLQRQQDSAYVQRTFDVKAELMISEELSIGGLLSLESVIPSDSSLGQRVFKSSTTSAGLEVQYDGRNDPYSPTSGVRYRTDYQYGRKNLRDLPSTAPPELNPKNTVQRFGLDLDVYVPMVFRQVLALGVHGRELRSGQIEEGEMFRLGGTRSLRGYRESQFLGSRVVWTNAEYRFLLSRRSFVFGFLDTGYYYRPEDPVRLISQNDAFKYGYGLGVQLETGLGLVGVSFALGQGDSFGNGKVHFGLINEF